MSSPDLLDRIFAGERHWSLDFWHRPLSLVEFCSDPEHLVDVEFSDHQLRTIKKWLGTDPAKIFDPKEDRPNICVLCWGKGSGKNLVGTCLQQYVMYILLSMRNPLGYFGFPKGESIDIVNVASSAKQAQHNFFSKFTRRVVNWKWLKENFIVVRRGKPICQPESSRGTIRITEDSIECDVGIRCVSAHSDAKGYEGYSIIFWVMDEASSWDTLYTVGEGGEEVPFSKAHDIYHTLRTSSVSRSWNWGGLIISYPRNEDDFTLAMAQDIQEGKIPHATADIASTWDVKPQRFFKTERFRHTAERPWGTTILHPPLDFKDEFQQTPREAELKYACIPYRTQIYFIYNSEKIIEAVHKRPNLVRLKKVEILEATPDHSNTSGYWGQSVEGFEETQIREDLDYFCHIDLSVVTDETSLGIAHGEPFEATITLTGGSGATKVQIAEKVIIDQIIEWIPDSRHLVSNLNVDEVLEHLDKTLRFRYISWDQFQSAYVLEKAARKGKIAGQHNVNNNDYFLLRALLNANAVEIPGNPILKLELEKLIWTGKRVDHLTSYSKDRADCAAALCQAVLGKWGKRAQRVKFFFG